MVYTIFRRILEQQFYWCRFTILKNHDLYGVVSGTSIAALFIAGIIPGLLIGIFQMITAYTIACKYNYADITLTSWLYTLDNNRFS